jgi:hypothetical protein
MVAIFGSPAWGTSILRKIQPDQSTPSEVKLVNHLTIDTKCYMPSQNDHNKIGRRRVEQSWLACWSATKQGIMFENDSAAVTEFIRIKGITRCPISKADQRETRR